MENHLGSRATFHTRMCQAEERTADPLWCYSWPKLLGQCQPRQIENNIDWGFLIKSKINFYHFWGRVGIPSQNQSSLLPQFKNLITTVDNCVGLIVGLQDPIIALAVGFGVSATIDRARCKIHAQLSWCFRQSCTTTDLIKGAYK